MERRKFDDSFQEAFKEAEVNPSENVWVNIELDLEKAEGGEMKRRLLFFKTLAAASVIFAMSIAGIGYYLFSEKMQGENLAEQSSATRESKKGPVVHEESESNADNGDELTNQQSTVNEDSKSFEIQKDNGSQRTTDVERPAKDLRELEAQSKRSPSNKHSVKSEAQSEQSQQNGKRNNSFVDGKENLVKDQNVNAGSAKESVSNSTLREKTSLANNRKETKAAISSDMQMVEKDAMVLSPGSFEWKSKERLLPAFYQPAMPTLQFPYAKADPGQLLLAKLAEEEMRYAREDKKQEKSKGEKLWTSVGFAAGGFNSLSPTVTPAPSNSFASLSTTSNAATKQSKASGVAYSVGVSVGTRLSNRWILQGGLNYLTQSSDYTANSVIVDNNFQSPEAESLNAFVGKKPDLSDGSSQRKVAQTFPYSVNNNVQFVSLPVQAGYLVVNKKVGVQLNAGLSTDLFLQNTITPDGGGIDKTTQSRGDDSPYRGLNFSGLMGTELSYKLGYHYRVSLNPGLRYPFNSVYKSNTGVDATPLTFDVGLRFRYIFH